uniref:Uncharacterized protein n=1 Tax=Meloidogyne enterolobii TaxID=390850 RepID=A0A6V7TP12_MELEN|nr:unnamed protein product [Meloidogyne enterolobii]
MSLTVFPIKKFRFYYCTAQSRLKFGVVNCFWSTNTGMNYNRNQARKNSRGAFLLNHTSQI